MSNTEHSNEQPHWRNEKGFPTNLSCYYAIHADRFGMKTNEKKRLIYLVAGVVALLALIMPKFFLLPALLVRLLALLGLAWVGFNWFCGFEENVNKASGGVIESFGYKKFDLNKISEERVHELFANNDFAALAAADVSHDMPLQFSADYDPVGKTIYCMLMKYYSTSDFSGASEVKELTGADYEKYFSVFKDMPKA